MTTTTCDMCGIPIQGPILRVTVRDGRHPAGTQLSRRIDACIGCCAQLPDLSSEREFDELRMPGTPSHQPQAPSPPHDR